MPPRFRLSLFRAVGDWFRRPSPPARRPAVPVAPDLQLQGLWSAVKAQYFPDVAVLDEYRVTWSRRRQRRVLASCNVRHLAVHVAQELAYPALECWLEPLLFHEMCHAVIGREVERKRGRRCWHGAEFKALVSRHPRTEDLEQWIKQGGWRHAVRSHRAKLSAARRPKRVCNA